jgi:hypothetical protein
VNIGPGGISVDEKKKVRRELSEGHALMHRSTKLGETEKAGERIKAAFAAVHPSIQSAICCAITHCMHLRWL